MSMIYLLAIIFVVFLLVIAFDRYVAHHGHRKIVAPFQAASRHTVIVPGAKVNPNNTPSDMLKDRLDTALALYLADKEKIILLSGDGRQQSGNETAVMAAYLQARGVPRKQIIIDQEGFDTFQTVKRAKYEYNLDSAVMTTQTFHLERAIYISNKLDFDLIGVASDLRSYDTMPLMRAREVLARVKAFYECAVFRSPFHERASGF